jgi:hypothetical protein
MVIHDPAIRQRLEERVRSLRPDATPRWGKMSVDQMLWHVNDALAAALGEIEVPQEKPPLPPKMLKFMVLNLPWMKGAPTATAFVAKTHYDFEAERVRFLRLLKAFADRPIGGQWSHHPVLGAMSGKDYSRLHAKHLNHHLTQFGV